MTVYAENLIGSVTVGAGGASTIDFTSIPSTYTDLVIRFSGRGDTVDNIYLTLNGSTSSFSHRILYGNGSSATSANNTTQYVGTTNSPSFTSNTFGNAEIYIPNYTSSNYKSISSDSVSETNSTTAYTVLTASLWSNTAAITSLSIAPSSGKYVQYSTAYLYGITNYAQGEVNAGAKAYGGIVSSDSTYYYHTFTSTGTFTPTANLTADYLVVAGGGSSGNASNGGGGGAGGLRSTVTATGGGGTLETAVSLTGGTTYTCTIGAGGSDGNGSNSSIAGTGLTTITSTGGGRGGDGGGSSTNGSTGGSGGGAPDGSTGKTYGSGTANQGYRGGSGYGASSYGAGGGGGAGAVGANGTSGGGGAGGNGVQITAFATPTGTGADSGYYAGGGGGAADTGTAAAGGLGGGGKGGKPQATGSTSGTANTGGGGGAYLNAGGSGIIIIRYAK